MLDESQNLRVTVFLSANFEEPKYSVKELQGLSLAKGFIRKDVALHECACLKGVQGYLARACVISFVPGCLARIFKRKNPSRVPKGLLSKAKIFLFDTMLFCNTKHWCHAGFNHTFVSSTIL